MRRCITVLPGQYWDAETGLHYNWNRYYDPEIGRYLTPDPVGGIKLYPYVGNSPVNYIDPLGLEILDPSGPQSYKTVDTKRFQELLDFPYNIERLPDCNCSNRGKTKTIIASIKNVVLPSTSRSYAYPTPNTLVTTVVKTYYKNMHTETYRCVCVSIFCWWALEASDTFKAPYMKTTTIYYMQKADDYLLPGPKKFPSPQT